jgi:hypothetical protein
MPETVLLEGSSPLIIRSNGPGSAERPAAGQVRGSVVWVGFGPRSGARWTPSKSSSLARKRPWMMTSCNAPSASRLASIASRWVKKTNLDARAHSNHPVEKAPDFENLDGRRVLQRLPRERYPSRVRMRHWSQQVGPRSPGIERWCERERLIRLGSWGVSVFPGMPNPRPYKP